MTTEVIIGDCLKSLKQMSSGTVQMCVTSPPYYGLRDYQTASWLGGSAECDHQVGEIRTGLGMSKLGEKYRGGGYKATESKPIFAKGECPHCGAISVDHQIGLEKTPEQYITKLVDVFREVRRVLLDDGTLWLNIGDSYCGYKGDNYGKTKGNLKARTPDATSGRLDTATPQTSGVKNKDLIGIPWMLAFALRADGWYLRQDIIWHKPNPMPESVTDRCTKSHEYMFLLSKSAKYYYDHEAIKEPAVMNRWGGKKPMNLDNTKDKDNQFSGLTRERDMMPETRNKRSVWTVSTKPYKGSHFAVFPAALIEPCVLSGSKAGDIILDPFAGSGTVGEVAIKHKRNSILLELNKDYETLINKRISQCRS